MTDTHTCQHEGCAEPAIGCISLGYEGDHVDPDEWLCPNHAIKAGYCGLCGQFGSGIDSFDFGAPPGYCDACRDEIRSNSGDDDGDEDDELPMWTEEDDYE